MPSSEAIVYIKYFAYIWFCMILFSIEMEYSSI